MLREGDRFIKHLVGGQNLRCSDGRKIRPRFFIPQNAIDELGQIFRLFGETGCVAFFPDGRTENCTIGQGFLDEGIHCGRLAGGVAERVTPDDPVAAGYQPVVAAPLKKKIHLSDDRRPDFLDDARVARGVVIETQTLDPCTRAVFHFGVEIVAIGARVRLHPALRLKGESGATHQALEQTRIAEDRFSIRPCRSGHGRLRNIKSRRRVIHPLDALAVSAIHIRILAQDLAGSRTHFPELVQKRIVGVEFSYAIEGIQALDQLHVGDGRLAFLDQDFDFCRPFGIKREVSLWAGLGDIGHVVGHDHHLGAGIRCE